MPPDAQTEADMEALLHDLRYAARQMLRQPVFATVAVVTLAIGKRVVRGEPARPRHLRRGRARSERRDVHGQLSPGPPRSEG